MDKHTKIEKHWIARYEHLNAYYELFGHSNVPVTFPDKRLAQWVVKQRARKNSLKNWQIKKLNDLNFDFTPFNSAWNEYYILLKKYKQTFGHTNVPQNNIDKEYKNLGNWCSKQREKYNKKKLPENRVKKLNDISFDWGKKTTSFDQMLNDLLRYKEEFGNYNVPRSYGKLGQWVYKQHYRKSELPKDKLSILRHIGFFNNH